jgi:predicted DNA-binding protein
MANENARLVEREDIQKSDRRELEERIEELSQKISKDKEYILTIEQCGKM